MNDQRSKLARIYRDMYKERLAANPAALTMDFWEHHFATMVASSHNSIQGRVLDLGCGTGEIDIWLARTKPSLHITAVDVCTEALEIAKKHLSQEPEQVRNRISFHESLVESLPFADSSFDCCIISHTLEHISDHSSVFRELYRVMKPGAAVLVVVPRGKHHDDPTHVWHFEPETLAAQLQLFGHQVQVQTSPQGDQLAAVLSLWPKPRIVAMMRIKNEEEYLTRALDAAAQIVDGFVILDDGSTDQTPEICRSHPRVLRYERQEGMGLDEARDKDRLLMMTMAEGPDWVLALDGDEVLEDAAAITIRREVFLATPAVTKLGLSFLYMWDREGQYRADGIYRDLRQLRLFRVRDIAVAPVTLKFRRTQHGGNFHCGSVPVNLPGDQRFIDVKVKRYGYFSAAKRAAKRSLYEERDPVIAAKGYYRHLTEEEGIVLFPWNERGPDEVIYSDSKPDQMLSRLRAAGNPLWLAGLVLLPGSRKHLDIGSNEGATLKGFNQRQITCIEAYAPAAKKLRESFGQVLEGDARQIVCDLVTRGDSFDRITLFDFIEHLPKEDGELLLSNLEKLATREIVAFVPMETDELTNSDQYQRFRAEFYKSIPEDQRSLQTHRSRWTPDDFQRRGYDTVTLSDFHFRGFSAFFAVKYLSATDRELALSRIHRHLQGSQPQVANTVPALPGDTASSSTSHQFGALGQGSRVINPAIVSNPDRIFIGAGVLIRDGARLEAVKEYAGTKYDPTIIIGDGTSVEISAHIAAAHLVQIGRDVMIGGRVTILDHDHGYENPAIPPKRQPLKIGRVIIDDDVCLGENAVVCRGVHIGRHAVIVANSVVTKDIPPFCVAVGNPAKVVKRFNPLAAKWDRVDYRSEERGALDCEPEVSIIIPTFNRLDFTKQCLASLHANTPEPHEIIIIDNASSDGTADFLWSEQSAGRLRAILNATNLGFAKACNKASTEARGRHLLFLNNDTEVTPGWLQAMMEVASDPSVGVVGAKLLYPNGRVQHAAIELGNGVPVHVHRFLPGDAPEVNQLRELDMVTGACLLVRKELFRNLGGFDEQYVNGLEDIDLCLRARMAGYRVVYQPRAVVYHHEEQSSGRLDHVQENTRRFSLRWGGRFDPNGTLRTSLGVIWEGAQFAHHSVALINRELCLSLIVRGHDLSILPTEPAQFGPEADPRFHALTRRFQAPLPRPADVHVRHGWPPDFTPPKEGHWVMIQPWEFGSIPKLWIEKMREQVDEVWVPSSFVRESYVQSGLPADRVHVVPNGVDTDSFRPDAHPTALGTSKRFKFLYVGGTIACKGIDVLLAAYVKSFAAGDDVCLVIKDMGGDTLSKGQTFGDQIREIQANPDAPEILYLTEDIAPDQLPGLYTACDCLVHPYRGEDFGLPIAEAMACGLPAIVTGAGACLDFCDDRVAYLIPASRRYLPEPRIGDVETVGRPFWYEPDVDATGSLMRRVFQNPDEARELGARARERIIGAFTWQHVAERALERMRALCGRPILRQRPVQVRVPPAAQPPAPAATSPISTVLLAHDVCPAALPASWVANTSRPLSITLAARTEGEPGGIRQGAASLPEGWSVEFSDLPIVRLLNQALEKPGDDPVLLLSADVVATSGWLDKLLAALSSDPTVAAVGPVSGLAPGPQRVPARYDGTGKELRRFAACRARDQKGKLADVPYLGGFCLLLNRAVCRRVGLLREDLDFPVALWEYFGRIRESGHRLVLALDAYVHHDRLAPEEGARFDDLAAAEEAVSEAMAAGNAALERGDLEVAAAEFRQVAERYPDLAAAHTALGSTLMALQRPREAVPHLRRAAELAPAAALHSQLGVALFLSGDAKGAEAAFIRAREADPADLGAVLNLVHLHRAQDRYVEATALIKEALRLDPNNADILASFASLSLELGDLEGAELGLQRLLAVAPDHPEAIPLRQAIDGASLDPASVDDTNAPAARPHPAEADHEFVEVSIVIPVHNRLDLTKQCLDAISRNTGPLSREVIVVDNGSTDGTREFLLQQQACGQLRAILNDRNLGFVGACNQGAGQSNGSYIVFLNNDTVPQPGWLDALVGTVERVPLVGAVGAKLVYPNGRLQEAGGIIFSDASGWNYGRGGDPSDPRFNFVREVDYCSGACLLVRANLFRALGGFDARYSPAYYEDTDLCFAIRQAGYRVLYQPAAVVVHMEGATAGTDLRSGAKRHQETNRIVFQQKWGKALCEQQPPNPALVRRASNRALGKRVLVVDPFMPMHDRASGSKRLYEILKIMVSQGHAVTFIARNGQGQDRYAAELQQMGIEVYATDPEKMAELGYRVNAPTIDLPRLFRETRYDVAVLSFYDVAEQYLPDIRRLSPNTRIVVDTVDVHFLREQRQAVLHKDPGLHRRAEDTKRRELAIYRQADIIVTVTEEDRRHLLAELPSADIRVIPNIHDLTADVPPWDARDGILFVGNFRHTPNVDGILYFCREVLPLVRAQLPGIRLTIVGDAPPPEVRALAGDGVVVTGYVPSTEPYLRSHRVSVAPLRYGAGLKGKIGEALANGLPVVTTSIGAEGMQLPPDKQVVMVADSPRNFAEAVVKLYTDPNLWKTTSRNGQQLVQARYTPAAVAPKVQQLLSTPRDNRDRLVSIVVLTYNRLEDTRACIDSLEAHTPEPYELIVVDNGSTDGTVDYLRSYAAAHDHVRAIANRANRGFAAGNNQALSIAKGEYVLLLNNDTVVTPGWLSRMLAVFQKHPQTGLVGPMAHYVSGPQLVPDPGYRSIEELEAFASKWSADHDGESTRVTRLVGFCLLARRAVIDRIGGLDERYGSGNFEDDDFCLRAAFAGYEARIARDVFIHHAGGQTFKAAKIDYKASLLRNWGLFKAKWGLPADSPYEGGYRITTAPPSALQPIPLPNLASDHRLEGNGRWWQEMDPATQHGGENAFDEVPATGAPAEKLQVVLVSSDDHSGAVPRTLIDTSTRPLAVTIAAPSAPLDADTETDRPRVPEGWSVDLPGLSVLRALNQHLSAPGDDPVLLLSDDITLTPGWLDPLLRAIETDPDVAIVGPVSNRAPRPQRVPARYDGTGKELRRFAACRARDQKGKLADVPYLGGFCLLLNRAVCRRVGLLREDLDFPVALWEYFGRIRESGHRLVLALDAYVHHDRLAPEEGARFDDLAAAEEAVSEAMAAGNAALERGDLEVAAAEFRQVAERYPDLAAAHAALGSTLLALGRIDESVPSLRRAADLAPNDAAIHNQLGIALYRKGDQRDAEEAFRRARELDPLGLQPLLNLVDLYRAQERYLEASESIKRALQLDPNDAEVLASFGILSVELGDGAAANTALQRLQAIDPGHPAVAALVRSLEAAGVEASLN